jgi:hypothetical protein
MQGKCRTTSSVGEIPNVLPGYGSGSLITCRKQGSLAKELVYSHGCKIRVSSAGTAV